MPLSCLVAKLKPYKTKLSNIHKVKLIIIPLSSWVAKLKPNKAKLNNIHKVNKLTS